MRFDPAIKIAPSILSADFANLRKSNLVLHLINGHLRPDDLA